MLYKKSAHRMILILHSFSQQNFYSDGILKIYSSEWKVPFCRVKLLCNLFYSTDPGNLVGIQKTSKNFLWLLFG